MSKTLWAGSGLMPDDAPRKGKPPMKQSSLPVKGIILKYRHAGHLQLRCPEKNLMSFTTLSNICLGHQTQQTVNGDFKIPELRG